MTAYDWKLLDSSNLQRAAYDPEKRELTVHFANNAMHAYSDVDEETFTNLCTAESAGRFFHGMVRGVYDSRPIQDEEEPA